MRPSMSNLILTAGASLLPLIVVPVLATSPVGAGGPAGPPGPSRLVGADRPVGSSIPGGTGQAGGTTYLSATLGPVNNSGASGTATATLRGDQLTIRIVSTGLAPGLPHAQHIHIGAHHSCPPPGTIGTGAHGQIRSSDAKKSAGAIAVSLTTTGDTSPDSSYALDRFPVGSSRYERTITVTPTVAAQLRAGLGVIEQHGVDANHSGRYDGAARSDVRPDLPEEASNSAACGKLVAAANPIPVGGVAAGGGGLA